MYTEENEFDYDAYLDEVENDENGEGEPRKPFSNKNLILKIILILLIVALLIFLFFSLKNNFKKEDKKEENKVDSGLVFDSNIDILRETAIKYFFIDGNLPTEKGETKTINVKSLIDEKLITEVLDYDSKVCGYNTSYISMTKNSNDYMLEIYLNCPSNEEKRVYYYDLDFNCLTCNGENYISEDEEEPADSNDNNDNSNNNSENNESTTVPTVPVCQEFGEWTTEIKSDPNLEVESRVLVKGYKEEIVYGEWSPETTEVITGNDKLEVAVTNRDTEITTTTDWSKYSTKKPKSKEGREIKTKSESEPYSTKSCSTETYTVNRTSWDNNALKCTTKGIGKVTCTYQKQVCDNVTKYKTVKYYKYRDTITETKNVTYYKSRTIDKKLIYTDYILESNMPDGYQKLDGSEITQYRYRTKCVK